jgi:phosphoribosylaminoimidazole-succinocarboxamide synthase
MKEIYKGKTKDVFELEDGNYMLVFKDDACGEDGVFDPGANQIIGEIAGKGKAGLKLTDFFFKKINQAGYPTHFINCDVEKAQMTVRPATVFGKGLEVICRYKAYGSFVRRYGDFIQEGAPLDALMEVTLKDDKRGDPSVTREILAAIGVLPESDFDILVELGRNICGVVKRECAIKGLELVDIKLEFGRDKNGKIILIDEVSGDIMRVFKDSKPVSNIEFTEIMTS